MDKKFKINIIVSIILLASVVQTAQAQLIQAQGTITRTLNETTSNFGGCMIALSSSIGGNCVDPWVSLDCSGTFSSSGDRLYATAMVAFSLNKSVFVEVDDTQVHGGFCVVKRLDVLQ